MWNLYLKKKITDASAWIGVAIIVASIFLPRFVTILLGLFLVLTPDKKLNNIIETWAKKVNDKI